MSALAIELVVAAVQGTVGLLAAASRPGRGWAFFVYGATAVASAIGFLTVLVFLSSGSPPAAVVLPLGLPWIGAHLRLDPLAAWFLLVLHLGSAAASLFALGYDAEPPRPRAVLPAYAGFLAAMNVVPLAADAFSFLFAWEAMSLFSFLLVLVHHEEGENRRAAYVYLLMAGFGSVCLLLAFGLLAGRDGSYAFADMVQHRLAPWAAAAVFLLAVLGAGSKAGLFPLHVWLPLAHPAAPSHVSALMSGVMTKLAVYSFVRIVFDLVGPSPWWWSVPLLVVAAATAVMGVLYALMQHDLKRLLAYHTVENIGIIFLGLGLALAFRASGLALGAAIALTAALLHVLNHMLFKSLLFLSAGAVLQATGERDMEHLGGLVHRMPATALAFLLGSMAISALPPLNGFVSEWLTFQAILVSPALPQPLLHYLVPVAGALLALAAALAAACFVKAFGVTFLGRARSSAVADAREVDRFQLAAMFGLVALCVFVGIVPAGAIGLLRGVTQTLAEGAVLGEGWLTGWLSLAPAGALRSSYNGLVVLSFVLFSAGASAWSVHRFASARLVRGPIWDCGYPDPSPATQYTAASFAQPIRRVFGSVVFRAREQVDMPPPGDPTPARLVVRLVDPAWNWLFEPLAARVAEVTERLNRMQFLTIRRYLVLVFLALVALLVVIALWQV
ncbi:Hydrogenase-4 component B [bacterium HR40]|nr:Hydrogenase-4 component B [bacterium HR40]